MSLGIYILVFLAFANTLHAQSDSANIADTLDHVWMLIAGALVFFMQAGFALLESGITSLNI